MNIIVKNDYEELSIAAAEYVADYIRNNPGKLLCFAAGDTPLGLLRELVKMNNSGEVDLVSMWYVGLDEWIGLGYEDKGSCKQIMFDNFYNAAEIPDNRIMVFDGKDIDLDGQCVRVDNFIKQQGGVGLTVLGIGVNGHLGFNEPGVQSDAKSLIVNLDQITCTIGAKYFSGIICPSKGITLGLGHLLNADKIVLIASGEHKSEIVRKSLKDKINTNIPASALQNYLNLTVLIDKEAASKL